MNASQVNALRTKEYTLLSWSIAVLSAGLLIFASLVNGFKIDQDLGLPVFLVYLAAGGLVASRHPKNAIGWFFLSGIFIQSAHGIMGWYADLGPRIHPGSLPGADVVAAWMSGMGNLGFGLLLFFPFLLFPNGQLLSRRLQDAIDRHFYRRKYDAARALDSFAASARDETDIGRLKVELLGVVQETMQPEQVILWLKENKPE